MNVVQVTPRYPPRTGGVETHVAAVSERLADRGHEVTVHTADAGSGVESREQRNGVAVRRHRALAPGGAFHVGPGIATAVRGADADVVHAHNYHSVPLFFAALGAGDATFVATPHYHGRSSSAVRDRLLSVYRPVGAWSLRRADAVLAVSEWERARLREAFDVAAQVVPNGVSVERFATAEPASRERPYLLSVGRLAEYKGVQYAIRALAELPGYDLLVVGTGPYADRLRAVAREVGVEDRVEFLGYVDEDRLPGLFAGAGAFLTLSSFEAYGMTVAEALSAGTPCVVHPGGALVEWCDRPGVRCVEDRDPGAVAAAIEAALGATPDGSDLPTWETVTDEIERVYARGAVADAARGSEQTSS